MSFPKTVVLFGVVIASCGSASAQQKVATLHISVEKLSYGDAIPKPFQGVGTFDLFRGSAKLDGANCPDKSGPSGRVVCTIPCKPNDTIAMVVRVKPPSDQDVLAGWVTPTGLDVEVARCAVKPASVSMRYEDARFALNKRLSQQYFAAGASGTGEGSDINGKVWISQISDSTPLVAVVGKQAATASGRAQLIELHDLATEAARTPSLQSPAISAEDKALAESLAKWQVLTKSALLQAQIRQALPATQQANLSITPTANLAQYRANLDAVDLLLARGPKSATQIKFADDIKALRSVQSVGKDATEAANVMRTWSGFN